MTVTVFDGGENKGEGEYQEWLRDHSSGYVINILRSLNPKNAKLHRPDCDKISDSMTPYVTREYVKVCGDTRAEVDKWAIDTVGTKIDPCRLPSCFGF